MSISKIICGTCGEKTDACYGDSGVLGLIYGQCQCRECYIKDGHLECVSCKELLNPKWKYCPCCGSVQGVKSATETWVVIAYSCRDCNSAAIATFDHKPTDKEVSSVIKECGKMGCIDTYAKKTIVNGGAITIVTG